MITAQNLTYVHAPGRGVEGISCRLEKGVALSLLGRNGSGKTTLTKLVCGLVRPQSGSLSLFGRPAKGRCPANLARMGICLDGGQGGGHLWEGLSGWDNAYFAARSRGMGSGLAEEQLQHFFEAADLAGQARDRVKTYSFGMRRKVSLIQAVTGWPELVVLDEPTTGLDSAFTRFLIDHIRARSGRGLTTWLASNDPGFCEKAAQAALILDRGRLAAQGRISDLISRAASFQQVCLGLEAGAGEIELQGLAGLSWLKSIQRQEDQLSALIENDPRLVPQLLKELVGLGLKLQTMEVKGGGLAQALEMAVSKGEPGGEGRP